MNCDVKKLLNNIKDQLLDYDEKTDRDIINVKDWRKEIGIILSVNEAMELLAFVQFLQSKINQIETEYRTAIKDHMLSVREQLASSALNGLLATNHKQLLKEIPNNSDKVAYWARQYADALLLELGRKK